MSITGLCQVCEQEEASHSCPRCGRVVCDTHFDEGMGYCTVCVVEVQGERGDDAGPGGEVDPDDVHR